MKAIVSTEYGPPDVLQLQEVEKPVPEDNQVRIKVHAAAVTFGEIAARDATFSPSEFWLPVLIWPLARMQLGFNKPRQPIHGSELAGEIESVGKEVKSFQPGDQVFGFSEGFGANAEYVCMPEDGVLAPKPVNLTYEEAAVVPHGAMTALHFMRDQAKIEPGQRVLINGASGGIGQYAVQLAKSYGAQVTGVCSTRKLELVRSLGADEVIDYTQTNFTQNGETYDVIFDAARVTGFAECRGSLTENGRYLLAVFKMREVLQMLWTSMVGSKSVICAMAPTTQTNLLAVKEIVEAGKLKPVIDSVYPMEKTAEAHRYFESGQRVGYVAVSMEQNNST